MALAFIVLWLLGYFMLVEISYLQHGQVRYLILLMWPFVSIWYLGKKIVRGS